MLRLVLVFGYFVFVIGFPTGVLFGPYGFLVGLACALALFYTAFAKGEKQIVRSFGTRPLLLGESHSLETVLEEAEKRWKLRGVRCYVMPSPTVNVAVFRLPGQHASFVFTSQALRLEREELLPLVVWSVAEGRSRKLISTSFLAVLLGMLLPTRRRSSFVGKHHRHSVTTSWRVVLRSLVVYPLLLLPLILLRTRDQGIRLDAQVTQWLGRPMLLAQLLRKIQTYQHQDHDAIPAPLRLLLLSPPHETHFLLSLVQNPTPFPVRIALLERSFSPVRVKKILRSQEAS